MSLLCDINNITQDKPEEIKLDVPDDTITSGININPNSVQNHQFTVQFTTPSSDQVQTCLYDISGKQVRITIVSVMPQTGSRIFIPPSNLSANTYFIVMQNETISYRQTLTIGSK